MTYSIIDGPEEVDFILESICLGFKFHLVHVGSINILFQEHKLVLCTCAFVDFIFIPVETECNPLSHLLL